MGTETTFWYKRREQVKGLIVECEDSINLYEVVRGWWSDDNTFLLQMKDAHEESRIPEVHPKIAEEQKKAGKIPSKERVWVLSYIQLHGIDIFRYRTATELMIPTAIDQLTKVQYPHVLNPPKTDVSVSQTPTGMKVVKDEVEEAPVTLPKIEVGDPIDPVTHMEGEEEIVLKDEQKLEEKSTVDIVDE